MSTYLAPVPGSGSSSLPATPSLSLLPFSLGSASAPFSSSSASTAQFFQPRPCPPNTPGIPEDTSIATFRGRQLVGHSISIPQGYRGLVISAPLPHQIEQKWPLTPAPSVASTSSTTVETAVPSTRRSPRKSALANVASSIKAKVRGAGQVALSKPKTRQTKREPIKRKRYQFDSDEEGEDGHVEHSNAATAVETPRKEASTVMEEADLPTIVVQEATPLKEPLPTPKKRLGQRGAVNESMPNKKRRRSRSPDGSPTPSSSASTQVSMGEGSPEAVIPSPATEDDPPAFLVESLPGNPNDGAVKLVKMENQTDTPNTAASFGLPPLETGTDTVKQEMGMKTDDDADLTLTEGIPTNARILKPSSTFDSFTLWTPDGPLPGFKQDETDDTADTANEAEEGGVKLRKGWWRTGGAGEGGDEIVRALGEWIGLVEELNNPAYLDDLKDDESEDDG